MELSLNHKIKDLEITMNQSSSYLFKVSTNFNGNKNYGMGSVIEFDNIIYCYPNINNYDINNFNYIIPKNGIYYFTFNLSANTQTNTQISLCKNSVPIAITKNFQCFSNFDVCNEGDIISVSHYDGDNIVLNMDNLKCSFNGMMIKEL